MFNAVASSSPASSSSRPVAALASPSPALRRSGAASSKVSAPAPAARRTLRGLFSLPSSARRSSTVVIAAAATSEGKLISSIEMPAFIPRADIISQLLRWAETAQVRRERDRTGRGYASKMSEKERSFQENKRKPDAAWPRRGWAAAVRGNISDPPLLLSRPPPRAIKNTTTATTTPSSLPGRGPRPLRRPAARHPIHPPRVGRPLGL